MLSKEVSSMTWPEIEPRFPGTLANTLTILPMSRGLCDVEANVPNLYIEASEFEFQSSYYVHFQTNTDEKVINLLYPTSN